MFRLSKQIKYYYIHKLNIIYNINNKYIRKIYSLHKANLGYPLPQINIQTCVWYFLESDYKKALPSICIVFGVEFLSSNILLAADQQARSLGLN